MATINDVARRAGVSPVTVSRVLNNSGSVSPGTRHKVEQAIRELGYVPSGLARSLRSRQTRALALILPDISNAFWTTVARGVEDVAQSRGYSVLLCNTDESLAKQSHYLQVVVSQRVDGVIIAPADSDAQHLVELRRRDIPTVVVDRRLTGWNPDTVVGDSISGARALVEHLIRLGHRRIAVITGPKSTSTAVDRAAGYCLALMEAGLPVDPALVRFGDYRPLSGRRLAEELLNSGAKPTAFFAANNLIAIGIIDALKARDIQIPQQIALVCFDDLPNTAHLFPFLTAAVQPVYRIGASAAEILLSRLAGQDTSPPRYVVLPTHLLVRHSCGSHLNQDQNSLSIPLHADPDPAGLEVAVVGSEDARQGLDVLQQLDLPLHYPQRSQPGTAGSNVHRLLAALKHQAVEGLPLIALHPIPRSLVQAVLSGSTSEAGGDTVSPEDQVAFALGVGLDAVTCDFVWYPSNSAGSLLDPASSGKQRTVSWPDPETLTPPPLLAGQLARLQRYLQAARGTGVGVIARFSSFADIALQVAGRTDARDLPGGQEAKLEGLMDVFLIHQQMVLRAVCDRFADQLALVLVVDNIADSAGPLFKPDRLDDLVFRRLRDLIDPALEAFKPVALGTAGDVGSLLHALTTLGFSAVHVADEQASAVPDLQALGAARLAWVETPPRSLFSQDSPQAVDAWLHEVLPGRALQRGYVLAITANDTTAPRPEHYLRLVRAIRGQGVRP